MAALFVWLWILGGVPAAVLSEVVRSASPRIARAGRIAFALLLGVDLLVAAVLFAVGNNTSTMHTMGSLWWFTIIAAGVPLALVSGYAVRRGYAGHRVALAVATLLTAALYFAFPLGFVPADKPLTGLGLWEHDHHALGIAILLIPTLILLVNELRWKGQVVAEPEDDRPGLRARLARLPKGGVVAGLLLLAVLIWMSGTNNPGLVLGLGVILAAFAVFLWWTDRSTMRGVRADLKPPEKPAGH